MRQLGLYAVANLDDGEVVRALQNGTRYQIAAAALELAVDGLTTCVAHNGGNNALCVLSGNAAHIVRRNIARLELMVLALFIRLIGGNHLVHVDFARRAIDGHACVPLQIQDALVAFCQRIFQALNKIQLIDLALVGQSLQSLDQFRICHNSSFPCYFLICFISCSR